MGYRPIPNTIPSIIPDKLYKTVQYVFAGIVKSQVSGKKIDVKFSPFSSQPKGHVGQNNQSGKIL